MSEERPWEAIHITSGHVKPLPISSIERRSLKEQILAWPKERIEELDYPVRLWRKILEIDSDFSDHVIRNTSVNVVEDVYRLYEFSGKLFREFLKPDLTDVELNRLSRIKRYYALVDRMKKEGIWKKLIKAVERGYELEYWDDLGRKHSVKIIGFCDGRLVRIEHFMFPERFTMPKFLGCRFKDLCPNYEKTLKSVLEEIDEASQSLKERPSDDNFNRLEGLVNRLKRIKRYEDMVYRTPFESIAFIEDQYAIKAGLRRHTIFLNLFTVDCPICEKHHKLWVLARGE